MYEENEGKEKQSKGKNRKLRGSGGEKEGKKVNNTLFTSVLHYSSAESKGGTKGKHKSQTNCCCCQAQFP